jgi:integrase/recombinase XerD
MSELPARRTDVDLELDRIVAAGFLARYNEPTRAGYAISLKQWFTWCEHRSLRPLNVQRAHVELWARELQEVHHLKASTVSGKLNAVAGMYRYAKLDGYLTDDPCEFVRRPQVQRTSNRQGLTRPEALACLDTAERTHPQDHALWCLLLFNGLRIGEALALNAEHLGRQGGYRTLNVQREKGNRSAAIPLAPRTSWAFDRWLGTRTTGPLFTYLHGQQRGNRMDRKAAARVISRITKNTGVTKNITPHSLRHTHVTMALNAGVTVRDLTNSMGYADSRQISYYDRDKDAIARNATHLVSAFVEGA